MVDENYLFYSADKILSIYDKLNNWAIKDLIERLIANDFTVSGTILNRVNVLQESGMHLQEVQKQVALVTKKTDIELKRIFEEAGIIELTYIEEICRNAGKVPATLSQSPRLLNVLDTALKATQGQLHNITQTIAVSSQNTFISEVDKAYFKVASGYQSYNQAIKEAVTEVAKSGVKIKYPSGHEETPETAVRRAVQSGVNKGTNDLQIAQAKEMGEDLLLTSQHLGARTGGEQAYEDHAEWQGKPFSISGNSTVYPSFYESTGYGKGGGLGGWGCRHHTTIFFEGISEIPEPLDSEKNKQFEKERSVQRLKERRIRADKRELQGLQAAIDSSKDEKLKFELQQQHDKVSKNLAKKNKDYRDYCKEKGLKTEYERLRVAEST
jgi:hypothetical protein